MSRTVVNIIVTYTDRDHPVEGSEKTRHFDNIDHALRFVERLDPHVTNVRVVKRTTIIGEEIIIGR